MEIKLTEPCSLLLRSLLSQVKNSVGQHDGVVEYILDSSHAEKPLQKLFHTLWISQLLVSPTVVMCLYLCAVCV